MPAIRLKPSATRSAASPDDGGRAVLSVRARREPLRHTDRRFAVKPVVKEPFIGNESFALIAVPGAGVARRAHRLAAAGPETS